MCEFLWCYTCEKMTLQEVSWSTDKIITKCKDCDESEEFIRNRKGD